MSRLCEVLTSVSEGVVRVRDLHGRELQVSLLAYEGPPPRTGSWLVVQSGLALVPADLEDAAAAISELQVGQTQETR
jgi:hydrogenase maturation factor